MRRALPVAMALACLLVGVATVHPASADDAPALRPGDYWTYRTNTSLSAGFFLEGTATLRVGALETRAVEGIPLDVVRMSLTGLGTAAGTFATDFGSAPASGTWVLTGEQLFEAHGMKVVSSVLDLEANGTLHAEPVPLAFRLSVQNTTTYRFLEDGWAFPIVVGDSGAVKAWSNFTEDLRLSYGFPTTPVHSEGIGWRNVTYVAEAREDVVTPAGRFDALRVRRTFADGTFMVSYFSPAAGNDVRSETHNESGSLGSADLVSYRYQALEPPRYVGLTGGDWAIALGVAATAGVATSAWVRHRRRRKRAPPGPPPA